jgi:hypothetical protein
MLSFICFSTFYLYPSSAIVARVLGNGYSSVAWLLGDAKIMIFCLHVAATAMQKQWQQQQV